MPVTPDDFLIYGWADSLLDIAKIDPAYAQIRSEFHARFAEIVREIRQRVDNDWFQHQKQGEDG